MVIKAFHESNGDFQRKKMIIPSSAHGTNPASAVMAGFEVVVTGCDDQGNIDIAELKAVADQIGDELAGIMVTYPSTHGVYEEGIREITSIIHGNGGSISNFENQIPYFSKKYQVILADSRAHGKSIDNNDSLSYEMMTDDLKGLLDHLHKD